MDYWAKKSKQCSICRRILRKISLFLREKSIKCPVLQAQFEGKLTFWDFWCKNTMDYWAKKLKSCSICRRILREKSLFLGETSIKCPVLQVEFQEKLTFWEFLLEKHTGLFGKIVKIVLDMQAYFEEKNDFFWEKSQ